jgi:hypothetical protein
LVVKGGRPGGPRTLAVGVGRSLISVEPAVGPSVELVAGGAGQGAGMTENLHGTPQSYETIGRFLALLLDHTSVAWNTTVAGLHI